MSKITFRGAKTGHNTTDRSKLGSKRHILTDKDGIPLSIIITSANIHDVIVAIDTVDSMIIQRSSSSSKSKHNKKKQNLCLDKAYHFKEVEEIIKRGYISHIRHRREEEKKRNKKYSARRWVVERTNSWHN
ncbi:MAG TPA: transposase [Nitrososphaeraceae archaeon]|nr:transposase [Nitrososphaeraceae archaeon]